RCNGCFKAAAYGRGGQRPNRAENIEDAVLNSVKARPGSSTRRLALQYEKLGQTCGICMMVLHVTMHGLYVTG
ncbi:hypothetical protein BDFB_013767, partial [Asbolus verrucosus]